MTETINWFGTEVSNPTPAMLSWIREQESPVVPNCANAEREIMYKLGDDIPFRGCWKCAECLKIKRQYRKPVSSWKELTPYWDCDDCCCVDIRGEKRHLPVGFLKHIAKAKGIEVASLKASMLKK
jgi:hypothetical protein